MHRLVDYAWIVKTVIYTMHNTTDYSLSMKHLSNSTNWMNSPKFKTKIEKTGMFL